MATDYRQFTLFSFILKAYEIIDNAGFDKAFPKNNNWDFTPNEDEYYYHSYMELITFLEKRGYKNYFDDLYFLSCLLLEIDNAIYNFDEYRQLFNKNDDGELTNSKYTLIIKPENSISRMLNKNHEVGGIDNYKSESTWLRNKRQFNPNKICYKLGFKHLNFVKCSNEFTIKQSFCISDDLSEDLENSVIHVGFFPFVKMDISGNPFIKIDKGFATFNINYKDGNKYKDRYFPYLGKALASNAKIILFPENSIPINSHIQIGNTLRSINLDVDKIIVAGTNWFNSRNTCYVLNDEGKLLAKQNKFNPYLLKEKNSENEIEFHYENLIEEKPHLVNLLHIKSFGLIGFPTCSDLISAKYIESIYCDCEATDLYVPCMSISKDVFSSLTYLSSHYWMSIFACNAYIAKNNVIGFFVHLLKMFALGKIKTTVHTSVDTF